MSHFNRSQWISQCIPELDIWILYHSLNHQISNAEPSHAAPRGPSSGFPMMRRCAATEAASRNVPRNFSKFATPYSAVRFGELYYSLHTEGNKWSYLHIFAFCWRLWYDSSFHVFPCDSDNTPSFCWQKRLWSTCFSVQLISKPLVAIVEALRRHSWVPWCCPLWKPMLIPLTWLADPKYDAVWPVTWYMIHEFSGLQMAAPIVSASTPLYTTQPCASKKKTTAMSQDSHPNAADLPNQKVNQINRKPTSQRWKLQLSASLGFFLTPGRWRRSSSMTSSSHQKRERSGTDALMQKWYVLERPRVEV